MTGTLRLRAPIRNSILFAAIVALVAGVLAYLGGPAQAVAANPAIDVEKFVRVNDGAWQDADAPTGPTAVVGSDEVSFRFVVTNTGDVTLEDVDLSDSEFVIPNGTVVSLGVGQSFERVIGPFPANPGQHSNKATVTGSVAGGGHFGPAPHPYDGKRRSFTFLLADGTLIEGSSRSGGVEVGLSDTVHISCSDGFGFGDADPSNDGFGELGAPVMGVDPPVVAYFITVFKRNGTPNQTCGGGEPQTVMDMDLAHYVGDTTPAIDIEKEVSVDGRTTWFDADDPNGPIAMAGLDQVWFRFTITNTGGQELVDLDVFELANTNYTFTFPQAVIDANDPLAPGASFSFELGPFPAVQGQHFNEVKVTAMTVPPAGNFGPGPHPYDGKKRSFTFLLADGTLIEGSSRSGDVEAGLSDKIHVSCSDGFGFGDADPSNDGFGEQGAPVMGIDPPVVAYFITVFKRNGTPSETCGGGEVPPPDMVMDQDPAHYLGELQAGMLGDFVWLDRNGDGIQDAAEPGVPGVQVELVLGGTPVDSTTTDAAGLYKFNDLVTGVNYSVRVVRPAGHLFTVPDAGGDDTADSDASIFDGTTPEVTLVPGEFNDTLDAGLFACPIDGAVVVDLTGLRLLDSGPTSTGIKSENIPAGIYQVRLVGADFDPNHAVQNQKFEQYFVRLFDAQGNLVYESPAHRDLNESPNEHFVVDTVDALAIVSGDAVSIEGLHISVVIGNQPTVNSIDLVCVVFDPVPPATLGDRVWEDLDRDGIQDGGEPGVPGVTVELLDGNMNPTGLTDVTDADGLYLFTDVAPGIYFVRFVNPDPSVWAFSPQDAGADEVDSDANPDPNSPDLGKTAAITLGAGADDRTWDAGLFRVPQFRFDKLINGLDADDPNDPAGLPKVAAGAPITVDFAIELIAGTNVPAADIDIVDDVFGAMVTAGVPQPAVSGPSGDGGVVGLLEVGETWTYTLATNAPTPPLAPGASTPGRCSESQPPGSQTVHKNTATATVLGIDGSDPAHLCVGVLDIDIEKLTQPVIPAPGAVVAFSNHLGADADDPNGGDVPLADPGQQILWNFVVSTGTGDTSIPAAEISVSDDTIGSIVNAGAPEPGITGPAGDDGDGVLEPGEAWVYTASGIGVDLNQPPPGVTVVPGCGDGRPTYENIGTVTALGRTDSDPSHYCNRQAVLTIEKLTNGSDADGASDPDVPRLRPGVPVTWTYQVANVGATSLTEAQVVVTDDTAGVNPVRNPALGSHDGDNLLEPGETWVYQATGAALDLSQAPPPGNTVVPGCAYTDASGNPATQATYENVGRVDFPGGSDTDPSHYCNVRIDLQVEKDAVPEEVVAGLPFDYTVTVTNLGPSPATDVVLLDLLPPRCQPGSVGPLGLPCPVLNQTDPPFGGSFSQFPTFGDFNGGANPSNDVNDPAFQIDNPDISPFSERQKPQGASFNSVAATGGAVCAYASGVHGVRCDLASLASGASFSVTINMTMDPFARVRVWNRGWTYADETLIGLEPNTIKEAGTPCGDASNTNGWPSFPGETFPQPAGPGCNYAKKNITVAPDAGGASSLMQPRLR